MKEPFKGWLGLLDTKAHVAMAYSCDGKEGILPNSALHSCSWSLQTDSTSLDPSLNIFFHITELYPFSCALERSYASTSREIDVPAAGSALNGPSTSGSCSTSPWPSEIWAGWSIPRRRVVGSLEPVTTTPSSCKHILLGGWKADASALPSSFLHQSGRINLCTQVWKDKSMFLPSPTIFHLLP